MKQGIHPKYEETTITCICGAKYQTRSTGKDIHVDICSQCHPFYTGKQMFVDTAGIIERFKAKYKIKQSPSAKKDIKVEKKEVVEEAKEEVKGPEVVEEAAVEVKESPAEPKVEETKTEEAVIEKPSEEKTEETAKAEKEEK